MPTLSRKQVRTAIKLLNESRTMIAEIVREEMLGLPKLPRKTKRRAKATAGRQKKG